MARISKTVSQREKELMATIEEAKRKLVKLQNKLKLEMGALVCKHNLQKYDISVLDEAFKKLAIQLTERHQL